MTAWITKSRKRASRAGLVVLMKLLRSAALLIPYSFAAAVGGWFGLVAYVFLRRDRQRAIVHLSAAYPEKDGWQIRQMARNTFVHLGRSLFEILALDAKRLSSEVTVKGFDRLREAVQQGRGVVFFTGHIGNWELMAAAVAAQFPLTVVAAPIEPEAVGRMVVDLRARFGVRTSLRSQQGAAREIIKVFRENRIIGLLIDQDTDVEGTFVNFMGRPAWTPTAAAQIALKFDAPVVFGYIRRGSDHRHTIVIEGPIELERTGSTEENIRVNTAKFTERIEQAIRECPEQWVWMHRRWRRQP